MRIAYRHLHNAVVTLPDVLCVEYMGKSGRHDSFRIFEI